MLIHAVVMFTHHAMRVSMRRSYVSVGRGMNVKTLMCLHRVGRKMIGKVEVEEVGALVVCTMLFSLSVFLVVGIVVLPFTDRNGCNSDVGKMEMTKELK